MGQIELSHALTGMEGASERGAGLARQTLVFQLPSDFVWLDRLYRRPYEPEHSALLPLLDPVPNRTARRVEQPITVRVDHDHPCFPALVHPVQDPAIDPLITKSVPTDNKPA